MVTCFTRYLFKQISFFVFQIKKKNEKQTSNLNFNVQIFWKSKNHLVWCFLSQLHYRNENQNFISNFVFQFIKKWNSTLGTRIPFLLWHMLPCSSPCKDVKSVYPKCHFVFLINWKTKFKILYLDFAFTLINKTKFK